jgi:hypothetical protein
LLPDFEPAPLALDEGKISSPIHTRNGSAVRQIVRESEKPVVIPKQFLVANDPDVAPAIARIEQRARMISSKSIRHSRRNV